MSAKIVSSLRRIAIIAIVATLPVIASSMLRLSTEHNYKNYVAQFSTPDFK